MQFAQTLHLKHLTQFVDVRRHTAIRWFGGIAGASTNEAATSDDATAPAGLANHTDQRPRRDVLARPDNLPRRRSERRRTEDENAFVVTDCGSAARCLLGEHGVGVVLRRGQLQELYSPRG